MYYPPEFESVLDFNLYIPCGWQPKGIVLASSYVLLWFVDNEHQGF